MLYKDEDIIMNMNIYIENSLGQQLRESAKTLHKSRNSIIREAIQEWLQHHKVFEWPPCILNFKGIKDQKITRFESLRRELTEPKDDPFK